MLNTILHDSDVLTIIRGESKTLRLEVTKDDPQAPQRSSPVNLTGAVVHLSVKTHAKDTETLIHKTSTQPTQAEITNALAGVAQIYLIPSDTYSLAERDYVYDVWIHYPATEKRFPVIRRSTLRIIAGVTVLPLP